MKVTVERKSFVLGWVGVAGRSSVFITEKRRKRECRVFFTFEGGLWLAGVLRQLQEKEKGVMRIMNPFKTGGYIKKITKSP